MPRPSAYRETEPAPRLVLCSAPECTRFVHARGLCEMHYKRLMKHGNIDPPRGRRCSLPECNEQHYGHGWCERHYRRWRDTGDPLTEYVDSPFYADKACPACGSKATVPFDQTPEVSARLGRKPAVGLGNCCACGFIFSALAPSSSVGSDGSPRPIAGGDGAGAETVTDPERVTRGRRNVPAATGTDGA